MAGDPRPRRPHLCKFRPAPTDPARTHVDIATFHLIGRPAITERLAALSRAGCVVSIVYAQIGTGNLRALTKAHVGLQQLCIGTYTSSTEPSAYVHSKYLLVQGNYRGIGANSRVVFTGSENWTKENLIKSDNRMIRYAEPASNSPIFNDYLNNFRLLRNTGVATRPTAGEYTAAND
jgi:phosphatidylserine/phosphatidylglycerophosphate/cardiolipin synthase-like enzyme